MAACSLCDASLDHCHGTLIVHAYRDPECTDPACAIPDRLCHTWVADCSDVAGGCECLEVAPVDARPEPITRTGPQRLVG
ncbi:hypothetical protein [Nocardia sp. NBC_00511]|uniref:hypothetical protein n=1 Tax=Nocardia sp. NBC_00511 TaxID=2903591 RepID=UPI0030E29002